MYMIDLAWQNWLRENIARGCNLEELASIMQNNGFSPLDVQREISAQLSQRYAAPEPTPFQAGSAKLPDFKKFAQVRITRDPAAKYVGKGKTQLYTFDNFLSPHECQQVIGAINSKLRPSTITTGEDKTGFRTSSTCDLGYLGMPFLEKIEKRIARTLGIRLTWAEVAQGQKYEVGQEFKAHTDYFEPNSSEYRQYASEQGQRTWTFMIYLNEVAKGGSTYFTALDINFIPKPGQAVIWNNLFEDGIPNPDTIHHGMPVLEGTKYIITKWFRSQGPGQPFFSAK